MQSKEVKTGVEAPNVTKLRQKRRRHKIWARFCWCGEQMSLSSVDWLNWIVTMKCPHDSTSETRVLIDPSHGGEGYPLYGTVAKKETHPYNCASCHAVDSPVDKGECINCGGQEWLRR